MMNFKSALLLSITFALSLPSSVFADAGTATDNGSIKVTFVRGKETAKTRSLKYKVYLGKEYVGRMKTGDSKEIIV